MDQTNAVDSFWETFNTSRCKTAMLLITVLVFLGVVVAELMGNNSIFLQQCAVIIVGYWSGRSSKAKENDSSYNSSTNTITND